VQYIAIGWDAQLFNPTLISKAGDHLYVYESTTYRLRRIALPIEFVAPYHWPPLFLGESATFTFAISRR
jgi:hypothetical protein